MVPECANIVDATIEPTESVRIAIRASGKVILTDSSEVICIESRGNHVLVRTFSQLHSARELISRVEEKLRPYGFVRIHRSTIVNGALVEEIRISRSGVMRLRLKGTDNEYNVSRRYKALVSRLAPAYFFSFCEIWRSPRRSGQEGRLPGVPLSVRSAAGHFANREVVLSRDRCAIGIENPR